MSGFWTPAGYSKKSRIAKMSQRVIFRVCESRIQETGDKISLRMPYQMSTRITVGGDTVYC